MRSKSHYFFPLELYCHSRSFRVFHRESVQLSSIALKQVLILFVSYIKKIKEVRVPLFIDREAREIMYLVASVRPSVRPFVCPSSPVWTIWPLILGARLCRVQQGAKKSHYQSKMFVCVSNNRADTVDRLLIYKINVKGFEREKNYLSHCHDQSSKIFSHTKFDRKLLLIEINLL